MRSINDALTHDNFLIYAAACYENKSCHSTEEFFEDLRRIKYIKKLITRFINSGKKREHLRERLILNHVVVMNNVFGPIHLNRMLTLKLGDQMQYVKPFLRAIRALPRFTHNVGYKGALVDNEKIPEDQVIVGAVEEMKDIWRKR